MITLVFALIGALSGVALARKRGGARLDMAQYAASMAIIGALLGLFVTIALARLL